MSKNTNVKGADFKAKKTRFFRPTEMSRQLHALGVIPGTHLVEDYLRTGVLRQFQDKIGVLPSVKIVL